MPFRFLDLIRRAPDDGTGAAAPAGAGDAAAADPAATILDAARAAAGEAPAAAAAADPSLKDVAAAAAGATDWKAPDFVPENLRGKSPEETLQKLTDAWKGFRDKDAKREKIPESAAGYDYKPSDKVAPFVAADLVDDPVFQSVREAALEAELPPTKFQGFMDKVFGSMVDLGIVDRPVDAGAVLGGMVPESALALPHDQQMQEAGKRVMAIDATVKAYVADTKLPEDQARELNLLVSTDAGLKLLERLLRPGAGVAPGLQPGGASPAAQTITKDSVRQRLADPRNDAMGPKFDQAFHNETRRQYAIAHANG